MKTEYTNQLQRDSEHQSYTGLEYDLMKERENKVRAGQVALSVTADFEEKTWTFQFENDDFVVRAGKFLIIPAESINQPTLSSTVDFQMAITNTRDLFCKTINKQEWNNELRTSADSLLIMYDQMASICRQTASQKGLEDLIEFCKDMNIKSLEQAEQFSLRSMYVSQYYSEGMATAYKLSEEKATELLTKK